MVSHEHGLTFNQALDVGITNLRNRSLYVGILQLDLLVCPCVLSEYPNRFKFAKGECILVM